MISVSLVHAASPPSRQVSPQRRLLLAGSRQDQILEAHIVQRWIRAVVDVGGDQRWRGVESNSALRPAIARFVSASRQ